MTNLHFEGRDPGILEPEWTAEEIEKALKVEPMTGAEIIAAGLAGSWKDLGIEDGVQWIEDQRRQRRERRLGC